MKFYKIFNMFRRWDFHMKLKPEENLNGHVRGAGLMLEK